MIEIRTHTGISLDLAPDAAFDIEMSNPLLESDRIPVAFSTAISFPPSETNRSVFGYLPAMLLPPTVPKVAATLLHSGIPLLSGTLVYDSVDEDGNLVYTFTEKEFGDGLEKKLWELDLPHSRTDEEPHLQTADALAASIRSSEVPGVGAPLLFDPEGAVSKFHNLPGSHADTRFTPCVSIQRMISAVSGLKLDTQGIPYSLSRIYLLGLHKRFTGTLKGYDDYLSIAQALPDVTLLDVLKEICKMFCAAIYKDGDGYALLQFDNIGYVVVKDWDAKMAEGHSYSREPAQGYGFGYPKEDNGNKGEASSEIAEVSTLKGVLDSRKPGEYVPVKHTGTGDTYSVPPNYIGLGPDSAHDTVQVCEILHVSDEDYDTEIDGNKVDNHLSACLIRNIPTLTEREEWDEDDSYPEGGTWTVTETVYRMAGLVSFPADGGERDSKMIIGVYEDGQLVGKGYKMSAEGADSRTEYSLSAESLYQRHQKFEAWLAKDRQVVQVDLDLSLTDISSFRMWHAVMVRNRMFIVKRLTLHLSMGQDHPVSSAELMSL